MIVPAPAAPAAPPLVLVVAYRADTHLVNSLAALGPAGDVLVVDNDAAPATRRAAEDAGARYLASPANVGFAAGVNLGLREAWDGKQDVLLLNPDARLDRAGLSGLQAVLHATGTRCAAVSPRLVDEGGAPQQTRWPMPSPGQVWLDAVGLGRFWRGRIFVIGAVLLLDGAALAEIGTLDERYFLYAEEADWQLRAQRAGWSVAVADAVTAVHVGAASSSDSDVRERLFHTSFELFARRWYGNTGWALARAGSLLAAARRSLFGSPESRRTGRRTLRWYVGARHGSASARVGGRAG